jgi:predicted  nucleic acid-binding Zn-ribbon protein
MKEEIRDLLELQKLDTIRDDIEARLKEVPELIAEEEKKSKDLDDQIADTKNGINELQLNLKNKEAELKAAEDFIKKQNEQLNTLKSNEAYFKMQHEISAKKEELDGIESEILEQFEKIEEKQQEINQLTGQLEEKKKEIKDKQDEYKGKQSGLESNKKEVDDKIAPIEERIKPDLLNTYKKIKERRDGVALAQIIDSTSCGGCHWRLPPQVVNEVLKEEEVVFCENCTRLLYMPDLVKDESS